MSQSAVSEWALGETPSALCRFLNILLSYVCVYMYV